MLKDDIISSQIIWSKLYFLESTDKDICDLDHELEEKC